MKHRMRFVLTLVFVTFSAPVGAQFAGPLSPGSFEATMGMGPIAQALGDTTDRIVASDESRPDAGRAPREGSRVSLDFRPSVSIRRALQQRIVDGARRSDPANAAQIEHFLATPDMFGMIDGAMAPLGLSSTNVADAFAIWWIAAWNGARGENDLVDRTTAQAVKRQAEAAMLSTPGIADLTDGQKQELAESYLIQLALIDASIEWAKANPEQLGPVKQAIAQGAKASGMDLSTVTLTEAGFVPASRTTGANDAVVSDAAEVEVAAMEGSSLAPLLYAAGGAGVAALLIWAVKRRG